MLSNVVNFKIEAGSDFGVTISPEHHSLHLGEAYAVSALLTSLAVGSITYIELITASVGTGIETTFQNIGFVTDQSIQCDIIEAPTITDGTTGVPAIQRNRRATSAPTIQIFKDPASVSSGTLLQTLIFGGSLSAAGKPLSPTTADSLGFNLGYNTKYVLKITNISATQLGILAFNIFIYEIKR